ncbi:uncharacterized protein BXZ73DRAFT_53155 [Epithele typhae]|uniref:uncharacterized protein n=1 Tax=Epithele typhae TaxID=378194 RepID=UPI0020085E22|nr:uncharacterized protein BXZ73DRAFT_53155 [Epithele typhae]KAH9917932.1 hypothetical protein BXZ73DRAFT_53155 [Epithele typhae]
MDEFDSYFDDDFVLDENSLATLQQEEAKFAATKDTRAQRRPIERGAPLPPPKKQKVSHGTSVVRPPRHAAGDDYDDDLPDIAVVADGTYGISGAQPPPPPTRTSSGAGTSTSAGAGAGPQKDVDVGGTGSRYDHRRPFVPPSRAPAAPPPRVAPTPRAPTREPTVPAFQMATSNTRSSRARASTTSGVRGGPPPSTSTQVLGRLPSRKLDPKAFAQIASAIEEVKSQRERTPGPSASGGGAQTRSNLRRGTPTATRASPVPASGSAARAGSPAVMQRGAQSPAAGKHGDRGQQQPTRRQSTPQAESTSDRALKIELEALKAQFEDLMKAQQTTTKQLEDAQSARWAKEGEVSVLRKNMEKAAKDHAAEVVRIKQAKEQAEKGQTEARKEMHAEIERIKTQFQFKQHELESGRKTPWSVRVKRTVTGPGTEPPTPQFAALQRHQSQAGGHSGAELTTPSRPGARKGNPGILMRDQGRKAHGPENALPITKHPKFENAFLPSVASQQPAQSQYPLRNTTFFASLPRSARNQASQSSPVRKSQGGGWKADPFGSRAHVHEPEQEDVFFGPTTQEFQPPLPKPRFHIQDDDDDDGPPEHMQELPSSSAPGSSSQEDTVTMPTTDDVQTKEEETLEPLIVVDLIHELHKHILTHRHHAATELTLQVLMHDNMLASAAPEQVHEYSVQSKKFLQCLGGATGTPLPNEEVLRTVAHSLSSMGQILSVVGSVAQLAALVDLLKVISLGISSFVPLAIAPSGAPGSGDAPPDILLLLCDAVRFSLIPGEDGLSGSQGNLAKEVLSLLEAICWYIPPELAIRLSAFLRKEGVLSTLVNPSQPTWLLRRTMRVLIVIASYHSLHKQLLSFPLPEDGAEKSGGRNLAKIPHIEAMAAILVDRKRDDAEARLLQHGILHFVTTLAVAHKDALHMLFQSQTLLHSIMSYLRDISDPLFEESEELFESPELVAWTLDTMHRTVILFHYLIMRVDPAMINVHERLFKPNRRRFNGVRHTFYVTFGRISYADPPVTLSSETRRQLDQMSDLAKDILEHLVDGPEVESTWSAFHIDDGPLADAAAAEVDEDEDEEMADADADS